MKKLLIAALIFASPLVTFAAVGAGCNTDADCDSVNAGEWCDSGAGGTYLCKGPSASTGVQTGNTTNAGFVPLTQNSPIPGITDQQPSDNMAQFFNNLYKILIGVAAVAAVIEIIIGGIQYATTDNVSNKGAGKARIYDALFGLILVLLPVLVFSIINPNILNLSVAWKPLSLPAGSTSNGGGTVNNGGGNNGGNQNGTQNQPVGTNLQKTTFTTANAANSFISTCNSAGNIGLLSCSSTNSQTHLPDCAPVPAECQHYSSTSFTFMDVSDTTFLWRQVYGNGVLVPAIESQVANERAFAQTCQQDGGAVCVTAQGFFSADLNCPAGSLQPSRSLPNSANRTCYTAKLLCADPAKTSCNNSWSVDLAH